MPGAGAARAAAARSSRKGKMKRTETQVERDEGDKESYAGLPYQTEVRHKYMTTPVQLFVAFLIFFNFFVSALEKSLLPEEETGGWYFFFYMEWVFGVVFLVELMWNMYGHWFLTFFKSGWNWFDLIIVLISCVALFASNLGGVTVLKLFRAFRVFRLFKRIESLRIIISGVAASIPPVSYAFVVLSILMGIWSILGVEFFGAIMEDEFGSFFLAMLTMFQLMTMDGWSDIVRDLIDEGQFAVVPWCISFILIASILMMNVVVAILIEKYLGTTREIQEQSAREKADTKRRTFLASRELRIEAGNVLEEIADADDLKKLTLDTLRQLIVKSMDKDYLMEMNHKELQHIYQLCSDSKVLKPFMKEAEDTTLLEIDDEFVAENRIKQQKEFGGNKPTSKTELIDKTGVPLVSPINTGSDEVDKAFYLAPVETDDGAKESPSPSSKGGADPLSHVHEDAIAQAINNDTT